MTEFNRRRFVGLTAPAIATAAAIATPGVRLQARSTGRAVIVGGGFGGATLARTLRRIAPELTVTLVEKKSRFVTCPFSNAVLGGLRDLESISFGYDRLRAEGVSVVKGEAMEVDPDRKRITLSGGGQLEYDRLVLAPGIDPVWNSIEGYDEAAAQLMPHAWQAGPQTTLLASQLRAMKDGGLVLIAVPDNPYRCPPGPYERASLIAHYLAREKPRSKVIIVDAKESFSKQALFEEAWKTLYPGMIEWIPRSQTGRVVAVDAAANTVKTDFDEFRADVANIIPPQTAGRIALRLGLDEGRGFCGIHAPTFESSVAGGIHLVGDAIIAGAMPKSGFSANSQAKVCAYAITALMRGDPVAEPVLLNTCYSLAGPDHGFTISGAYRARNGELASIQGTGGVSSLGATSATRKQEAEYARAWYQVITREMFG